MKKVKENLKARKITLSDESFYMISNIIQRKLLENKTYRHLPSKIKDIIDSNVFIIAATDRLRRLDDDKAKEDVLIGNIKDAINLVMKDIKDNTYYEV